MAEWITSGRAVDVVLAVLIAEAIWLRWRLGWAVRDIAAALLPGAMLLVAWRTAVSGAPAAVTALALAATFPVHLFDLARRRRGGN